jgi:hypothetical protein
VARKLPAGWKAWAGLDECAFGLIGVGYFGYVYGHGHGKEKRIVARFEQKGHLVCGRLVKVGPRPLLIDHCERRKLQKKNEMMGVALYELRLYRNLSGLLSMPQKGFLAELEIQRVVFSVAV